MHSSTMWLGSRIPLFSQSRCDSNCPQIIFNCCSCYLPATQLCAVIVISFPFSGLCGCLSTRESYARVYPSDQMGTAAREKIAGKKCWIIYDKRNGVTENNYYFRANNGDGPMDRWIFVGDVRDIHIDDDIHWEHIYLSAWSVCMWCPMQRGIANIRIDQLICWAALLQSRRHCQQQVIRALRSVAIINQYERKWKPNMCGSKGNRWGERNEEPADKRNGISR